MLQTVKCGRELMMKAIFFLSLNILKAPGSVIAFRLFRGNIEIG